MYLVFEMSTGLGLSNADWHDADFGRCKEILPMNLPRPEFVPSRPSSQQEAAVIAKAALARAGQALRQGPAPCPKTRSAHGLVRWIEPIVIGVLALLCAAAHMFCPVA